jgi:hypothetical protein
LSVSGDLAYQYIPVMNCIFRCATERIPIDICKIAGDTVFNNKHLTLREGSTWRWNNPRTTAIFDDGVLTGPDKPGSFGTTDTGECGFQSRLFLS